VVSLQNMFSKGNRPSSLSLVNTYKLSIEALGVHGMGQGVSWLKWENYRLRESCHSHHMIPVLSHYCLFIVLLLSHYHIVVPVLFHYCLIIPFMICPLLSRCYPSNRRIRDGKQRAITGSMLGKMHRTYRYIDLDLDPRFGYLGGAAGVFHG